KTYHATKTSSRKPEVNAKPRKETGLPQSFKPVQEESATSDSSTSTDDSDSTMTSVCNETCRETFMYKQNLLNKKERTNRTIGNFIHAENDYLNCNFPGQKSSIQQQHCKTSKRNARNSLTNHVYQNFASQAPCPYAV